MLYGGTKGHESGSLPSDSELSFMGTKNGLNASGEVCLVAFGRSKVKQVTTLVDITTGMVQTMMCQAKKANPAVSLPAAVGAELGLKVAMGEAMGPKADRIDKARITRLKDVNGLPVYSTEIVILTPMGEREVHLVHSPDEVSDEYSGTLYSRAQRSGSKLTAAGSDKDSLFSVVYAKKKNGEEYRMKYELRAAQVNEGLVADAFTSEGQLDLNVGVDFSLPTSDANYGAHLKADGTPYGANEAISGMTYILFDMNPATNEGTVAYWQNPGASWNEATRGMVATLEKSNDGFKGCAISGAALGTSQNPFEDSLSIRKSIKK